MPKIVDKENGKFKGSLHYPTDLGVGFTHPDCVKITIGTNPGVSLAGVKEVINEQLIASKVSLGESFNKAITDLNAKITATGDAKPSAEKREELTASLKIATDAKTEFNERVGAGQTNFEDLKGIFNNIGGVFKSGFDAFRKGQEKNIFTSIDSIYLPMPENLVYNEPVDWTGTDLGMMKGAADALLGKGGSSASSGLDGAALSQAGNMLAGGAGAIVSKLLGGGMLGGAVLGGLGGGAAIQGAIESNLRIKGNPFKEQTFQGIGFRPFEFSFVFNARSQTEVNTIRKIINTFRQHSKPSLETAEDAIFQYPSEFQIEFLTKSDSDTFITNSYLPRIKQCVCKSVNTNFTTAGWESFEGGAPTTITLQLGFEETQIITAGDVEESNGEKAMGRSGQEELLGGF
jgi:hypothetical protein